MGTSKNKTRQTLFPVAIHKPIKDGIELRDGLFVALEDGYIIPATSATPIEWIAINDVYNKEETKEPSTEWHDRMCIYNPKRRWETFTIDVENGEITQEDVWQTFLIIGDLQHINYSTKAENWWQFRLEQVITPTRWEFTYYFDSTLSPQWPKWEDGDTPTFTFSPVQTLPVGSQANAIVDKEWNNYDITFQIPAWANGKDGEDGEPGGKWWKWDTVDWEIGQVTSWWTAAASVTVASPLMRQLNLTIPKWQDGENWLSPTPRDEWNSARSYSYLDIVRYPDQDGIWCTWIRKDRDTQSTATDIPWESDGWMLLVRDGADWKQWEPGWTIVVPVEWRPGRDWNPWAPWEKGNDWLTPHSEWIWSAWTYYSPLSMVRADTWETDEWGNPIYWYYVTNNWASWDTPPKDSNLWDLVSKDWMASDWNKWSAMVFILDDQEKTDTFVQGWDGHAQRVNFTHYTWNHSMTTSTWLQIIKTWHYRVYWHMIVQNNTWDNMLINLGRASIMLVSWRTGSSNTSYLATAKQWWVYATVQWPWLDLTVDCEVDLYEWDSLTLRYRAQTDTTVQWWEDCVFTVKGAIDSSGASPAWFLGWTFATYLGATFISKNTPQSTATNKTYTTI